MTSQEDSNNRSPEGAQGRWERIDLGDLASPFASDPNDRLIKFQICDWFPSKDPIALLVLQFLVAWEDLATIDRFKEVLGQAESQVAEDEIGTTRWRRGHFFLLRVRLGIMRNIFEDLIEKWSPKHLPQERLISALGSDVKASYDSLLTCRSIYPKLFTILERFRHKTIFHYDTNAMSKALNLMKGREGEIILSPKSQSIEFIAATQVLDMVPAGQISSQEVEEIHAAVDQVQSQFRTFVYQLLLAYTQQRSLLDRIRSSTTPAS
jgi:hypothetical protein